MTSLNRSTSRRLQKLPQTPNVWEGDRCPLSPAIKIKDDPENTPKDCILWVDGSDAVVRSLEMVSAETGYEAVVRALLRAMESPNPPATPGRPQKIVVRDRELQFYLRGVLQDLKIAVEYAADLPIIDEIQQSLQSFLGTAEPIQLPAGYAVPLLTAARDIWATAPWQNLDDAKTFAVELDYEDVGTLYVSLLGMLGEEYGVLLYRTVESLKSFREKILRPGATPMAMEEAFLEQDCFFMNYEPVDEAERFSAESPEERDRLEELQEAMSVTGMMPSFGVLHPLEGMRQTLYAEEAAILSIALDALNRFFQKHLSSLDMDRFPKKSGTYRIPDPIQPKKTVSVSVSTMPDLSAELEAMAPSEEDGEGLLDNLDALREFLMSAGFPVPPSTPVLQDDLIPEGAFYSLGSIPWDLLDVVRMTVKHHQKAEKKFPTSADGFPVILIQTSRPKAQKMIEALAEAEGVKAIAFNPGEDPYSGTRYDLGIIQTEDGDMHLFGEFDADEATHIQARKKWDQRCKKTKGHCGLIIARGVTGAARGNPGPQDMMALYEVRSLTGKDLGLGSLKLMPQF